MTIEESMKRYEDAAHAVQSGVAQTMNIDRNATTPKHLRVGLNLSKCEHAALVRLLISKGFIGEEEYYAALADEAEAEQARYEESLSHHYKANIKLA